MMDSGGLILAFNQAAEHTFDFSRDEVLGLGADRDDALERMGSWAAEGVEAAEFEALSGELRLSRHGSLPGRALELGEAVWVQD